MISSANGGETKSGYISRGLQTVDETAWKAKEVLLRLAVKLFSVAAV